MACAAASTVTRPSLATLRRVQDESHRRDLSKCQARTAQTLGKWCKASILIVVRCSRSHGIGQYESIVASRAASSSSSGSASSALDCATGVVPRSDTLKLGWCASVDSLSLCNDRCVRVRMLGFGSDELGRSAAPVHIIGGLST